jgi:ribonuclease J
MPYSEIETGDVAGRSIVSEPMSLVPSAENERKNGKKRRRGKGRMKSPNDERHVRHHHDKRRVRLPVPSADEILILPLGGCDAIGMNTTLYGHAGKWIVVDAGCQFADEREHPGIDAFVPDTSFLAKHADDILALVVTHGHEDHVGGVQHLLPKLKCPIHATPFAARIIRDKLEERGLRSIASIRTHAPGETLRIGPFVIETIRVAHSIPESTALAITVPIGTVLHTGDWKFDDHPMIGGPTDEAAIARIAAKGLLAMACDSTNSGTEGGTPSEMVAKIGFDHALADCDGAAIVACFASNVARVKAFAEVARAHGRTVAIAGRSLEKMTGHARLLGHLDGVAEFLSDAEIGKIPRRQRMIICTGTQGEERAALGKIVHGRHRFLRAVPGDTVFFSARRIPGNEEAIDDLQNRLENAGIEVVTPERADIHVSGHPSRDDLARMMRLAKPACVVPIHGTPKHIRDHADLATELGFRATALPFNGAIVRVTRNGVSVTGKIKAEIMAWDGARLSPAKLPGSIHAADIPSRLIEKSTTAENEKSDTNPVQNEGGKSGRTRGRRGGRRAQRRRLNAEASVPASA